MNDDRVEVEFLDDETSKSTESVESDGSSGLILVQITAVVGVCFLLWALIQSGSSSPEASSEEAVLRQGTGLEPMTTTVPSTTAPTSTTTSLGGPLLGQETGLWLYYGGEAPLQRLDLDTGLFDRFGHRSHPVLAIGPELVMARAGSGALSVVSLADPGEQADNWSGARVAWSPTAHHLWTFSDETWRERDLLSSRVVRTVAALAPAPLPIPASGLATALIPGPELVSTPDGVFEVDVFADDPADLRSSARRVASGQVLTYDDEHALVQRCPESLTSCSLTWFGRTAWQPVDVPLPDSTRTAFAAMVGKGSFLYSIDTDGGRQRLTRLGPVPDVTDASELTIDRDLVFDATVSLAIGPTGRWLATSEAGSGVVSLFDLDRGQLVETVTTFETDGDESMVFVAATSLTTDESPN